MKISHLYNFFSHEFWSSNKYQVLFYVDIFFYSFSDLKQENADMKAYIDKLLAKVLIHCPDALAADGDLGPPK